MRGIVVSFEETEIWDLIGPSARGRIATKVAVLVYLYPSSDTDRLQIRGAFYVAIRKIAAREALCAPL